VIRKKGSILLISLQLLVISTWSQSSVITVKADQRKAEIKSTMWGIFFEDINMSADGGVYAELVKNRSFEFAAPIMGWKEQRKEGSNGSALVINRTAANAANPRYLEVNLANGTGLFGLTNEGFRGMGIKEKNQYNFSILAKASPNSNVTLHIELVNAKGEKIGESSMALNENNWKKYNTSFTATATEPKAKMNLWFSGKGVVDLDMVSLFPQDTWKNRPGGLRADLVQLLADMKPGFLRFPGGCIVEGRELATRYQWKKTIGPVDERELIINRWNTEFKNKLTPDYYQSFGLGFLEYFQLAEDIGAAPLPILNCGMACQFNSAEVVPVDQIDPYVQDALDLIEFANGTIDTKWGGLRARLGHPSPFHLTMLGIGNEQWGPQYIERYRFFAKALKEKHPEIQLVNSTGTDPTGDRFNYLNDTLRKMNADILDEHYYRPADWFLQNAGRYDEYDRNGPKIFAGEYAAQSTSIGNPENRNNWKTALAEAAYMTGLERNADLVSMASYAPLFAHTEAWQWTPDLIWFDNLRSYGTPNYYVQKLYATNKGTTVVPMLQNAQPLTGQQGLYASACVDEKAKELILKIVNVTANELPANMTIETKRKLKTDGKKIELRNSDLEAMNSLNNPTNIKPEESAISVKNKTVTINLPPYCFTVIRIPYL